MATLAAAVEAIRDRIEDQTSLKRSRTVESLRGLPDHLQSSSFAAWPGRSSAVGTMRPGDGSILIADDITLELAYRLRTADEIGSLDSALANARSVRIALTAPSWYATQGLQCVEWTAERRTREGGWVILSQTYRVTRQGDAG